jgi:glycosyltransferase involved in cell wall biosynthesis
VPKPLDLALVNLYGNADFSGGVPRAALSRAEYLVSKGHRVTMFFQAPADMSRVSDLRGIRVVTLPVGRITGKLASLNNHLLSSLILGRAVARAHREHKFDLVDLHDGALYFGFARWLKSKRIPSAYTIHSSAMLNPEPRPERIVDYYTRHELRSAQGVKLLLPVSKFVFTPFQERGFGSKGKVVYNCVPTDAYQAGANKSIATDSAQPLKLVFAARYAHVKGFDTLVEALLKMKHPERVRITTYGQGPYEAKYRELASQNGLQGSLNVQGQVSDRKALLQHFLESDCFVLPTRYEAFSVALLEARGCGMTTLSTNIPPNLELDPGNNLMHDPGDAEGLAKLMEVVVEDRQILKTEYDRGRAIAKEFLAERTYPALEEAYRSVL